MSVRGINILLGLLLIMIVAGIFLLKRDLTEPNVEFLPEMKRSPAYSAFEKNTLFANGRTLQTPVPGTIARGELPLYFAPVTGDDVSGKELENPYDLSLLETPPPTETETEAKSQEKTEPTDTPEAKPDQEEQTTENKKPEEKTNEASNSNDESNAEPENNSPPKESSTEEEETETEEPSPEELARQQVRNSVQRGKLNFQRYCAACHGPMGLGDGQVAKRSMLRPQSLLTGKAVQLADGQIFYILTKGIRTMPKMSAQLSREARWDTINYLRTLQKKEASKAASQSETTTQENPKPETNQP